MTPDDLDSRLRRALDEVSSAWRPNGQSPTEFLDDVGRRRMRRHRSVVRIGCAVSAAVIIAIGAGVYSTTSRTDNRVASGASLHRPTPSTGSGSTTAPGLSQRVGAPSRGNDSFECASVKVESGVSRCAGVFFATPSATPGGFATASAAAGTSSTTATPPSVTVKVGQHVAVSLPATAAGSWRAPVVVAASSLSAPLRQELSVSQAATHAGVMRAVGRVRAGAKQSGTSVFEAVKSGDVVLMATLAGTCARTSNGQATIVSPACAEISTQWLLLVVVSR